MKIIGIRGKKSGNNFFTLTKGREKQQSSIFQDLYNKKI